MEKRFLIIFIGLSAVLFTLLYFTKKAEGEYQFTSEQNAAVLKDSANRAYTTSEYTGKLLMLNYEIGNVNLSKVRFYEIIPGGDKHGKTFNDGRQKFIIRYSTIGCNTCVNLIFKHKERLDAIRKKYDLVVLVDFDKYEDYVKWKRATEFDGNIYWVAKGELPFDAKFNESSYSFLLDKNLTAHSFFIPNNIFPKFVFNYLDKVIGGGNI
jgi:hypothetical protein